MEMFQLTRAQDVNAAIRAGASSQTAQQGAQVRFLAGGTTLVDLMKLNVERPAQVVDINHLPLDKVEPVTGGGLRIGALVRNSDLANDATVKRDYAVLSQALLAGASGQLLCAGGEGRGGRMSRRGPVARGASDDLDALSLPIPVPRYAHPHRRRRSWHAPDRCRCRREARP